MHYTMAEIIAQARILKWGNSYGIRIRKQDLERAGLKPGEEAIIRIEGKNDRIDLSHIRFFKSGRHDISERHDEELAKGRTRELRGRRP